MDCLVGLDNGLSLRPASVGLQIQRLHDIHQLIHGGLSLNGFLFNVLLSKLGNVLLKELSPLIIIVRRPENSLTLNDWPDGPPTTVVFDFRMPFQHGIEICSELSESFFRPILFLHANLDRVFLKGCFAVSRVFEGTVLRIFDDSAHCLFPGPLGLDIMTSEHFHERSLRFIERVVFRFHLRA